jgi:hypothetical protein
VIGRGSGEKGARSREQQGDLLQTLEDLFRELRRRRGRERAAHHDRRASFAIDSEARIWHRLSSAAAAATAATALSESSRLVSKCFCQIRVETSSKSGEMGEACLCTLLTSTPCCLNHWWRSKSP